MTRSASSGISLGEEGERALDLLATAIEMADAFDLHVVYSPSLHALKEMERRLLAGLLGGEPGVRLPIDAPGDLDRVVEESLTVGSHATGTLLVLVAGPSDELRAAWGRAAALLNERRNLIAQTCRRPIVLAGPDWLPAVIAAFAPDLWSVRGVTARLPDPPSAVGGRQPGAEIPPGEEWPLAHQLRDGSYYEGMAQNLAGSSRRADRRTQASLLLKAADAWHRRGELDQCERNATGAAELAEAIADPLLWAAARDRISRVLQSRGDLRGALHILQEEEVPIYERVGAVRSRASAIGKIADILAMMGDLQQAIELVRDKALPELKRLGDDAGYARATARMASILHMQGNLDDAIRVYSDQVLPVYERLGDVRERAVTLGKIADILYERGDVEAATRVRLEEQLPVYDKLGDKRAYAVTLAKVADALGGIGRLDEALRILHGEVLPRLTGIGAELDVAVTVARIADILSQRGEPGPAVRLRREQEVPVYERHGMVLERARALEMLAMDLSLLGQWDEALRLVRDEAIPAYQQAGASRSLVVGQTNLANLLLSRDRPEDVPEATRLLEHALAESARMRLPEGAGIKEMLGEARSRTASEDGRPSTSTPTK